VLAGQNTGTRANKIIDIERLLSRQPSYFLLKRGYSQGDLTDIL